MDNLKWLRGYASSLMTAATREQLGATAVELEQLRALADEILSHEWTTPRDTAKFCSRLIYSARAIKRGE